jgi:hypothetical protein
MNTTSNTPPPPLLDRAEILALFAQSPDELRAQAGSFVFLAMLPIEERIGEWYLGGDGGTLWDALASFEALLAQNMPRVDWREFCREVISAPAMNVARKAPRRGFDLPKGLFEPSALRRVVFYAEGGAPYDDTGFCLIELEGPLTLSDADRLRLRTWLCTAARDDESDDEPLEP